MSLSQRMLLKIAAFEKLEHERTNDRRLISQAIVTFDQKMKDQQEEIRQVRVALAGFFNASFTERLLWLFFGRA